MENRFVVLEGLDGSGKSSLTRRLANALRGRGLLCHTEREPSDSPAGGLLRQALERSVTLREETMALLFAADRVEHIHNVLLPRLSEGACVLCDRYVFSNLAYQGAVLPPEAILAYNQAAIRTLMPGLTVYIDVEPEECLRRIARARKERELFEELGRLTRVREGFERAFALLEGQTKLLRLDGNRSEDEVAEAVIQGVWDYLQQLNLSSEQTSP